MSELPPRPPRRFLRTLALAVAAVLGLLWAPTQAGENPPAGKTFAAYEFGWYPIGFVDHFQGPLGDAWERHGPGSVQTQNGMLTVLSVGNETTGATLRGEAHDRGRWEIRLRGKRFESGATDFTIAAELVPAGSGSEDCGARDIVFADFRPAAYEAGFHIRSLPDHSYDATWASMSLSTEVWHTYGVEVTPRRISWFVDGEVRATERRAEALSGIPLDLRLELQAVPGATMNETRLQVDTVRYFSLKNPNDKSVRAPRPTRGTYAGACPSPAEPAGD